MGRPSRVTSDIRERDERDEQRTTTSETVVVDPATGIEIGRVAIASAEHAAAVVECARAAASGWARTSPARRGEHLADAARLLRGHVEELTELQTSEMGKPLGDSRGGVLAGVSTVEQ